MLNTSLMMKSGNHSALEVSLDDLVGPLGFDEWKTLITTIILPFLNIIGTTFCSLSLWIFFRRQFVDSIFVYYRHLCIVYILSLLHNIPAFICFSPQLFPGSSYYFRSLYQYDWGFISAFLFRYGSILEIGILLTRMKIFSPFLKKHFTAPPRVISTLSFLTCLLIDLPLSFMFKIKPVREFFYLDLDGLKKYNTFFYLTYTEFAESDQGKIILGITYFIFNMFLTLVVGVLLNILSFIQYKRYLRKRWTEFEGYRIRLVNENVDIEIDERNQRLSQKELNERTAERNMLYMIITLSFISIISRVVFLLSYVFFLFFTQFSDNLATFMVSYGIYTFVPTISIFIFYFFNKIFRLEFRNFMASFS